MQVTLVSAHRRALAAVVLLTALLASTDAAMFKVRHPYDVLGLGPAIHVDCSRVSSFCYSTRPGWAIPMAIAIGLGGILVAALLYRPRSPRAAALSGQPAILRSDGEQAAAWGLAPPHA